MQTYDAQHYMLCMGRRSKAQVPKQWLATKIARRIQIGYIHGLAYLYMNTLELISNVCVGTL